jgi:N-acyl homoserine lactone hydrolase
MSSDVSGAAVELDVLVTGIAPMPKHYVFRPEKTNRLTPMAVILRPGGEMIEAPCLAYAVRHPSAGTILIDTGFHRDASEDRRKDFGRLMAFVFRNLRPAPEPYDEQLGRLGVAPGDVERVIMTHLHVDHTSGMRLLPNARFISTGDEWASATGRGAAGNGYISHHLPPATRLEFLDFDDSGERYGPFSSTIDLLGDGSVRLISTPGHTRGHMSVLLRVAGGRQVLVIGDAVYTLQSVRDERLPLLTASDESYLRSLREIKAFSEQDADAILVPTHDPTAWHELRHVTASAENALTSIASAAGRWPPTNR